MALVAQETAEHPALIRQHGLSTVVADGVQCSSACALAWLAGKERFMGATARIGFHAISHENGELSSEGNAIVGAYLYEIGITQSNTITYLTMAPPNSMKWISKSLGQAFKIPIQQPIPFVDAPWAKPALLSWLPRDKPAAKTEAKTETMAIAIGTTGHVIRTPTVSGPGIWDTVPNPRSIRLTGSAQDAVPTSLVVPKAIVPPVPQVRCRRFESPIPRPPDQAHSEETCDAATAQE
jgi:hypothetical protein